ncbi:MmgE/PrpD family protein [Chloroflexota bacterium]
MSSNASTSTVSEKIAEWVITTKYSDIPTEVVNIAKLCILDSIGVTLAGTREPVTEIVRKYLNNVKGAEQSTVIGLGIKTICTEAAFANGLISHCLDYDDYLVPMAGAGGPHITATVLPAALAMAEKGNLSGKELIEAYILGCEVTCGVGHGVDPTHYNLGWHTTGTEGIFGATVAAAKLLGLSHEEMTYALGTCCSEASGLRENFGTMTKPFHAGQAASKGIKAAMLAKLGFNSSKSIFEGRYGFGNVLSKKPKTEEIPQSLGKPFCLPQIVLKLYPCCGGSHTAIYAALKLRKQYDISAADIEQVDINIDPLIPSVLVYETPQTALEGKFSMQFPIALALAEGEVTLPQFTDGKVKDPEIVALMQKVKLIPKPELCAKNTVSTPVTVEIKLKGGRKLAASWEYHPGTPHVPHYEEGILGKYKVCARLVLPKRRAEESMELIMHLEEIDDVSKLLELLVV